MILGLGWWWCRFFFLPELELELPALSSISRSAALAITAKAPAIIAVLNILVYFLLEFPVFLLLNHNF